MRGNKLFKRVITVVAILCMSVATTFLSFNSIDKVNAEDNSLYARSYCSQHYDDGVVFSAEQVYFNYDNRNTQLYYDANKQKELTNILGHDGNNYFANYSNTEGGTSANDIRAKKIINSGDFVMVDNSANASLSAYDKDNTAVSLHQGIMLTLGGYIYEENVMYANSYKDANDKYKASNLQWIGITIKRNGSKITDIDSADGSASLRTYDSGLHFDFVYFLKAEQENEGYYEIALNYTLENGGNVSHTFDFYLLLTSSYNNPLEVNGNSYTRAPGFNNVDSNASGNVKNAYSAKINEKYPLLTYDYKHYDLTYSYVCNDTVTNVDVSYEYDLSQSIDRIKMVFNTNGIDTIKYYDTNSVDNSNNIVSFLFSQIGSYSFSFNYVYYYNGERLVVDNLSIPSFKLDIHGYEIHYAKTGVNSSIFRKLSIVENGTMLIPVGGYQETEVQSLTGDLGYIYEIVSGVEATGSVKEHETPDYDSSLFAVDNKTFTTLNNVNNINTDQGGVWLNLNDSYVIDSGSYYFYSSVAFKTGTEYGKIQFNKDTTFTKTGYYFVAVQYKVDENDTTTHTQYFMFRISSSTANVSLFATNENEIPENNDSSVRLYSNQFTNKNVYAKWADPTTFESKHKAILYYANKGANPYQSKDVLIQYANGVNNASLTSEIFDKNSRIIKDNGSYLLELQIVGTQTRAYYYFVIDKEDISGIDILGVSSATIGKNVVYNVATDENNNPITYTESIVINNNFTMWWNDKASGAQITGNYKFVPIIYSKQTDDVITGTENGVQHQWLFTNYSLGNASKLMTIEKPATKYSVVNAENVLKNQGIYWFELEDQAGNQMNYMVIIDRTEAKIIATAESGVVLNSGDVSAEKVSFEWGTHKTISSNIDSKNGTSNWETLYSKLISANKQFKYFASEKSNLSKIADILKSYDNKIVLAINNEYMQLTSSGHKYLLYNNGLTSSTGGEWVANLKVNNNHNVTLTPAMQELSYTLKVFGSNHLYSSDSNSFFTITLNKDKSEGTIRSKYDETAELYNNKVYAYNDEYTTESNFLTKFAGGQATDDGLIVFEWLAGLGTDYEVAEVYYEYFPKMSQEQLDNYRATDTNYKYYPYDANGTVSYIFGGSNNAQNYQIVESNGKTVYRSHVINSGYISYNEGNNVVYKNATKPGMYVITRKYTNVIQDNSDATIRKYVFFVDRNQIIDYNENQEKEIGNYIDLLLQNSYSFNDFTSNESKEVNYNGINYTINLSSNRLPLEVRVPTGKFASFSNGEIVKTSNSNSGGLKFDMYFVDRYNYLGIGENAGFKLFGMADMQKLNGGYVTNGYITYLLNTSSLYTDEQNGGNINRYLKACNKINTDYLSLPGYYIINIYDNVGTSHKEDNVDMITDNNRFSIGVEIVQKRPSVNAYVNTEVDKTLDEDNTMAVNLNENNTTLASNKAFAMYELELSNPESKNAIVDYEYIYITRTDKTTGRTVVYFDSSNESNGIYNSTSQLANSQGKLIIDKASKNGKVVVWLDTGLVYDGNKLTDYNEYVYNFNVRYKLFNNDNSYYTYNKVDANQNVAETINYYENSFTVDIDRTPNLTNLYNILNNNNYYPSQREFLEAFINEYAKDISEEELLFVDKLLKEDGEIEIIFNTLAYKNNNEEIYYSVVNKLFYYLISQEDLQSGVHVDADKSLYAIMVNSQDSVDLTDGRMFIRELESGTKSSFMSLLSVSSKYDNTAFIKFNENDILGTGFRLVQSASGSNWGTILGDDGYYEIVEVDSCGNYTQYIVYYASVNSENHTIKMTFTDSGYDYTASFEYANSGYGDWLFNEIVKVVRTDKNGGGNETESGISFALQPFASVTDMFGNVNDNGNSSLVSQDAFYKVVFSYLDDKVTKEEVYFLNLMDNNLAEKLYNIMKNYTDNNYTLSITNRFNQTLTIYPNVIENNYKLNVENFVPKYDATKDVWYLEPKQLNSAMDNGVYYAQKIELKDQTLGEVVVYELNSLGEIIAIDSIKQQEPYKDVIVLKTGDYYSANITDMVGKTYTTEFSASEFVTKYAISYKGVHTSNNNINYTSNEVKISYNEHVYDSVRVRVYLDGRPIIDESVKKASQAISYNQYVYVSAVSETSDSVQFTIYPYKSGNRITDIGACLEYIISYKYQEQTKAESHIIIDNRVPTITLNNEKGEDKTNIVAVGYVEASKENEAIVLNANDLFTKFIPTVSLSETVRLGWDDIENVGYKYEEYQYFNRQILLYCYDTQNDVSIINLTDLEEKYRWISPKENSIGRYVLVYAIMNNENLCMTYKVYAFNISSTANSMYEIHDSNGKIVEYKSFIKGSELETILQDNWSQVKATFGFEDEAILNKFKSQNVPIFIANTTLQLVPNGDNGVSSSVCTQKLTDEYTMHLYKVYNDVHSTYACVLEVKNTNQMVTFNDLVNPPVKFVYGANQDKSETLNTTTSTITSYGDLIFPSFFKGNMSSNSPFKALVKENRLTLDVYFKYSETRKDYVGNFLGEEYGSSDNSAISLTTSGTYIIYLKDYAGNTHVWGKDNAGNDIDYLTLVILPEALITVNGEVPVDYAYYNGDVTVAVCFSNYYDNASTSIRAYKNGSSTEFITSEGGRKTNLLSSFTFTKYGTYRVEVSAKYKGNDINKTLIFSIINGDEARLALDFTAISKYDIYQVTNYTTGNDVTDIFTFLINEGFIYSKLITFDRLSAENAFGSTMGKQTFEVKYRVQNDPMVPARECAFRFTINNQTPSMQCSLAPGESTTKEITIKFNPQTIYRQVGDCYIVVNDTVLMTINKSNSHDRIVTLTLSDVDKYYVKIVSDSGRVISSFQVTIKEPLNAWSILLIVAIVLVVLGVIITFIVLRTKMRVR